MNRTVAHLKYNLKWGEWPSGPPKPPASLKLSMVRNWMGDLPDERPKKQLTPSSFGTDVKLGVPCLDTACTVGLN